MPPMAAFEIGQRTAQDDDAALLAKTLKEEKETDAKLTEIARRVNPSAMSEGQTVEEISLREEAR